MRWLLSLCCLSMFGQSFTVNPRKTGQGSVIRVQAEHADHARMNGRTIRLFPQTSGLPLGLMPVPVLTRPGVYQLEFLQGSSVVQTVPVTVTNAHYPLQNVTIQPSIAALKPSPGEQEAVAAFRKEISAERYWSDRLQLPVPGCLTSAFGVQRAHNGKPTGDFHAGLDQRGAAGSPIHAVSGGIVKIAREFNLRGGTVAIDHGQGVQSIYMHMSGVVAKEGEQVKAGNVIGQVGSTGRSNAPHLHWTLYVEGEPVNPGQWVTLPASCGAPKKVRRSKRTPR